ncbi:MAG: pentapeptide repeat-containing protein [Pseudomonadota bacterium]|nr:pentapeptide repeat-containing protein [Pseudomonadota bacterium]
MAHAQEVARAEAAALADAAARAEAEREAEADSAEAASDEEDELSGAVPAALPVDPIFEELDGASLGEVGAPPAFAEAARAAEASPASRLDAQRLFWRIVVPAVTLPVGPLRRAGRQVGVLLSLVAWGVRRGARFVGEQLRWAAQVVWRVLVAGFARGLPAAWRALAAEANAGADVPSAEESVEFRVEAVARERALAKVGAEGTLVARRAVARRRAELARERRAIERRAAEPNPTLRRLARAQVAAASARQAEATRRGLAEAETARWAGAPWAGAGAAVERVLAARLRAARLRHAEGVERVRAAAEAEHASHEQAAALQLEPPLEERDRRVGREVGARVAAARARRAEATARAGAEAAAVRQARYDAADAQRAHVEAAAARRALLGETRRGVEASSEQAPGAKPARPARAARGRVPRPEGARRPVGARGSWLVEAARRGLVRLRGRAAQAPVVIGPGAALAGRRLDDRDLGGADLRGADLRGASLIGTNLRGARLAGADLRDADLTDAVLAGADLTGARLEGACLDHAVLDNAVLDDTRLVGARMVSVRGLAPGQRAALGALGADVGLDDDGRWVRIGSMAAAASVVAVMGLYLAVTFAGTTMDRAALEHAAAESQRQGNPGVAAGQFAALAQQTDDQGARVALLLEAAAAAEESGDVEKAMDLLDEATIAAEKTGAEARVRLRRAATYRRIDLADAAAAEYRALLDGLDLTPTEQAEALTGLALVREDLDVVAEEDLLLAAAATDLERSALALALADGWAAAGRMDASRSVLERALGRIDSLEEAVPARLRLARLFAESGDADGALVLFEELLLLPGDLGAEARLGASELRARRGDDPAAFTLLEPLLARADDDLGARARFAAATIAGRSGDIPRAVSWLEEILEMEDVEPRMADEARILLARLLVRYDPEAAARLVEANPALREELLLGQARSLREAGKRMDARALWVEVAEDVNASEEARVDAELSLAELQVEEGDAEGALRRYERVMGAVPSTAVRQRVVLGLCNALVRLGRLQDAEEQYDGLLASGPGPEVVAQANLGLARTAELRGQFERATSRYVEIGRQEGPWAVEALDGLGQLRERTGDLAGAAEAWRLARARALGEPERRTAIDISLARVLDAMGDPGAADAYAALLDATDATVRVAARIAVAEGMVGSDPEQARTYYEQAIQEAEPGEARAAARAGWLRASVALGDVEGGLARIRAWLETETDGALRGELAVAAAQALRSEGRLDAAIEITVTYGADGGFELGMHRAGALRELGRGADAAAVLRGLVAATAEDEVWRVETLSEASIEAGDLAGATAACDRLDELPGGTAAASFGRARLARERGDYVSALRLLSSSEDARAPMERATVLEGLGKMDEAETAWDRLAISPDLEQRSAGVLGIARVRLSREDPAGALAELDALPVVADGFLLTAAQVRAEALLLLRRFDEAALVYGGLDRDAESRVVGALGLGEVALARDDARSALVPFRQALDRTSDPFYQAQALSGIARAQAEAGAAEDARATLARLRKEHPDRADAIQAAEAVIGP